MVEAGWAGNLFFKLPPMTPPTFRIGLRQTHLQTQFQVIELLLIPAGCLYQPGHKERVLQPGVQHRGAGKEVIGKRLVQHQEAYLISHAPLVTVQSLFRLGNGLSGKLDPANHDATSLKN